MIRNFTLTNALGASFSLMNAQQGAFFEPQGLGFDDATQYEQVGEFFAPLTQRYGQQVISGSMVFGSQPYEHYLTFTKFCQHAPLSLVYETDAGTFQIPCRLTKIEKGDTDGWTYLNCKVEFTALARMYKTVVANNTGTAGGGKVYSEKDLPDITGSIVTIDNAEAGEILNITADIDTIQDLHGYDAPWVGGAGKNKCDLSAIEIGKAWNLNTNSARATVFLPIKPNTTYAVSVSGGTFDAVFWGEVVAKGDTTNKRLYAPTSFPYTVTTTSESNVGLIQFNKTNVSSADFANVKIQVEEGSTATSWTPYENICPISGHDDVTVTVADDVDNPTVSEDYTTTLPSTTYGGTLDLVSGELTVTHAKWTGNTADMDNSNDFPGWRSAGIATLMGTGLNNLYPNVWTNVGRGIGVNTVSTNDVLMLPKSYYGLTQTEWIALAEDIEILIELATPQTYQLTPQQIQTLLGQNNVWANSGNITITGRKTYGYEYNYTYGDFVADTVTIDSDSVTASPCRISIFGECTNPTWRHYLDGNSVATGYYNGTIPSGHKLVIDTTSSPYSIEEQDIAGNLIADRYELCDFSTERFFLLEYGHNTISVSHTDPDSIRLMVEGYIFYETV